MEALTASDTDMISLEIVVLSCCCPVKLRWPFSSPVAAFQVRTNPLFPVNLFNSYCSLPQPSSVPEGKYRKGDALAQLSLDRDRLRWLVRFEVPDCPVGLLSRFVKEVVRAPRHRQRNTVWSEGYT